MLKSTLSRLIPAASLARTPVSRSIRMIAVSLRSKNPAPWQAPSSFVISSGDGTGTGFSATAGGDIFSNGDTLAS
ncbi:hypothetical protein BKA01_002215 [Pseudonocardia eucalypti]|nr:hypothetical protein [Pseudonocardia eucalypti]